MADVMNLSIRQVQDPIQVNARGAAFIAAVGLGYMTFADVPRHVEFQATCTPNPENRAAYDKVFGEFVRFYEQTKNIYKRLNGP
jgi:xylulokinase